MTTDVRTLLHDAAEAPSRAPDADAARHRGAVAAAASARSWQWWCSRW